MNNDMILPLLPIPFFVISLVMYTIGAHQKSAYLLRIFQPLTAGIVVLTAVLSLLTSHANPLYSALVVISLLVCFAADMSFVNAKDDNSFLFLLCFFVVYHITAIAAISCVQASFYFTEALALPVLLVIVIPFLVYIWSGFKLMGNLALAFKIGVSIYSIIWMAHVMRACSAFAPGGFSLVQAILLSVGSLIFLIGDTKLGAFKFRPEEASKSVLWKTIDLLAPILYGCGQLMYALSASYFPA